MGKGILDELFTPNARPNSILPPLVHHMVGDPCHSPPHSIRSGSPPPEKPSKTPSVSHYGALSNLDQDLGTLSGGNGTDSSLGGCLTALDTYKLRPNLAHYLSLASSTPGCFLVGFPHLAFIDFMSLADAVATWRLREVRLLSSSSGTQAMLLNDAFAGDTT